MLLRLACTVALLGVVRGASLSLPLPGDLGTTDGSWTAIARCAIDAHPLDCVETRSQHAVDAMLAPGGRAASGDTALEPEIVDKVGELSEVLVEAAATVLERRVGLVGEDEKNGGQLVEEGRGKKKKKIHKLIALVKLVLLVLVVKLKLAFLMMALQTLFQFKLVVMVFMLLLIKKVSLWAQLKAKHSDAQKVVYYEHAQHQHHYDDHGWAGGHDEHAESGGGVGGGGGGGWSGLWGRSYDTLDSNQGSPGAGVAADAAGTDSQNFGVHSGVYRAADGTRIVIRPPDAHDMAYSAQRP